MPQRAQQLVECCVRMYTFTNSKCIGKVSLSHDNNRHRLPEIFFFLKKRYAPLSDQLSALRSWPVRSGCTAIAHGIHAKWMTIIVAGQKDTPQIRLVCWHLKDMLLEKGCFWESQPARSAPLYQNLAFASLLPPADTITTRKHHDNTTKAYGTDDDSYYMPKYSANTPFFCVGVHWYRSTVLFWCSYRYVEAKNASWP